MSEQPICPSCQSAQAVQRVAAIHAGGTQNIRVLTADLLPAAGVTQTNLAALLAPPRQPSGSWLMIILLFGSLVLSIPASCMITLVIMALQGQSSQADLLSGSAERIFGIVVGIVALGCLAVGLLISNSREQARKAEQAHWQAQIARWQQSWYCHRCHAVFVAGTSKAIPPEQFAQVLGASQ